MLYKLYLDFDGVIWDTWPYFYKTIREIDNDLYMKMISKTTNVKEDLRIAQIFRELDWEAVLKNTKPLRDSLVSIKYLDQLGIFDMSVLTHCNNDKEIFNKRKITTERIPETNMIPVIKPACKTSVVDPRGAILVDDYWKNLKAWEDAGGIAIKFTDREELDCPFYNIDSLSQVPNVIEMMNYDNNINKFVKVKR